LVLKSDSKNVWYRFGGESEDGFVWI